MTESQQTADKLLQSLVTGSIDLPQREIAGLSQAEQQSIEQAQRLSATGDIGSGISDVLLGTLRGEYDPRTSPFYQGFRDEAQRLKEEGISDVLRRSQRLTGAPSGVAQRQAGDVSSRADESILQALGGLYEQERGRQFQAAPIAAQTFGGISSILAGAGGLERSIEQQILDAQFAERQGETLAPYQIQAPIASSIMSQNRYTFTPGTEGSSLMQDIAGVAGIVAAPFTGGASLGATALGAMSSGASAIGQGLGSIFGRSGATPGGPTSIGNLNTGMPANPFGQLYA